MMVLKGSFVDMQWCCGLGLPLSIREVFAQTIEWIKDWSAMIFFFLYCLHLYLSNCQERTSKNRLSSQLYKLMYSIDFRLHIQLTTTVRKYRWNSMRDRFGTVNFVLMVCIMSWFRNCCFVGFLIVDWMRGREDVFESCWMIFSLLVRM